MSTRLLSAGCLDRASLRPLRFLLVGFGPRCHPRDGGDAIYISPIVLKAGLSPVEDGSLLSADTHRDLLLAYARASAR